MQPFKTQYSMQPQGKGSAFSYMQMHIRTHSSLCIPVHIRSLTSIQPLGGKPLSGNQGEETGKIHWQMP